MSTPGPNHLRLSIGIQRTDDLSKAREAARERYYLAGDKVADAYEALWDREREKLPADLRAALENQQAAAESLSLAYKAWESALLRETGGPPDAA